MEQKMKLFKGKAVYCPKGKAAEYSKWAVNFYTGCSARCEYCYNRHGITAKVLGADKPTLKKSLVNKNEARKIFMAEVLKNLQELQKHGLFFNFVSDPCLPETWSLNSFAMMFCIINGIGVKLLTKQTWWLDDFISEIIINGKVWSMDVKKARKLIAFGFTLTGHDELEPGAATNADRIKAMKTLNEAGFKTWASIEPIIDINSSMAMIQSIRKYVDLVKVGLKSGAKYNPFDLRTMYRATYQLARQYDFKVYFKDSFVKMADIHREDMPDVCVNSDYNLFEETEPFKSISHENNKR
jgi:DNA repair photolyase